MGTEPPRSLFSKLIPTERFTLLSRGLSVSPLRGTIGSWIVGVGGFPPTPASAISFYPEGTVSKSER